MRKTWESERLLFRAVENDDEEFLGTLQNDPESFLNATHFLAIPPGKSTAAKWRERMQEKLMLGVIICLKAPQSAAASSTTTTTTATSNSSSSSSSSSNSEPVPIGTIGLSASEANLVHHRNCMLGVNITNKYHGKGYGSEAIRWAVRWGFLYANMHRIELQAFSWNPRAISLYQRLGFAHEGVFREACWFEGEYGDVHLLAMLKHEWEARYGAAAAAAAKSAGEGKVEGVGR